MSMTLGVACYGAVAGVPVTGTAGVDADDAAGEVVAGGDGLGVCAAPVPALGPPGAGDGVADGDGLPDGCGEAVGEGFGLGVGVAVEVGDGLGAGFGFVLPCC